MKKHERILERRKLFKQEFLRPLAAMMYYEIGLREWKFKEKLQIDKIEGNLLSEITAQSDAFHDFLQSHEFTHHKTLAIELLIRFKALKVPIRGLEEYYRQNHSKPQLFDAILTGATAIRKIIEALDAFEKRNEDYTT
jgi:hypothetical protein